MIFNSIKFMGKTTDTLGRSKFQLLQNSRFKPSSGRENNIELLILVLDFMVNYRLKMLNSISVESMECLNEDA